MEIAAKQFVTDICLGMVGLALAIFLTFFIEPPQFWRVFRSKHTFRDLPLFWSGIAVASVIIVAVNLTSTWCRKSALA